MYGVTYKPSNQELSVMSGVFPPWHRYITLYMD